VLDEEQHATTLAHDLDGPLHGAVALASAGRDASHADRVGVQVLEIALELFALVGDGRQARWLPDHLRRLVADASLTLVPALPHRALCALVPRREAVVAHPPATAGERPVVGAPDRAGATLGAVRGSQPLVAV